MNHTFLPTVKRGDIVEITPIDKLPNADRILNVYDITSNGILYGVTEYCDGYVMPLEWIADAKIIGKWR